MNKNDPIWWAAKVLHQVLTRAAHSAESQLRQEVESLLDQQNTVQRCWQRCDVARSRGWHLAAAREQRRLMQLVPKLQHHITNIVEQNPEPELQNGPNLRELLAELAQLHHEFEPVIIDPKRSLIAVQTESVTLKDVDLGRFQIELYLDRLSERSDSSAIDIVALDPNPATSNESVTHPHVSDHSLCAGDASAPLRSALKAGRLCDVFLLVQGVLGTYNPGSAYVALEEWSGVACSDCGYSRNSDGLFYCPSCQSDFCDTCIGMCDECEDSFCGSCLEREHETRRKLCSNCRATCSHCGHVGVASEIEEDGVCGPCREEQQQKEFDHEDPEPGAQAHAA